jgi:hypothetical protein
MMNFNNKRRKKTASLFCLSLFLVITVSCYAAPIINWPTIVRAANTVVSLIDVTEKVLYLTSNLVNNSYEVLGEDIRSQDFRTDSNFSTGIIEKMEVRHSELLTKHKELDSSLDKTNVAANKFFSLLETKANKHSNSSLRENLLRDISVSKGTFAQKIEVARGVSSKLGTSIKNYEDMLIVFQINVGLAQAQKYLEDIDSIVSQYKSLEQEVQIALSEGRQVITNSAEIPSQSPEATLPSPSSEAPVFTPTPENDATEPQSNRPLLGVKLITLTPELRQQINQDQNTNLSIDVDRGVLIVEVAQNSAAARANIQVGDVIVAIDSKTVTDANEVRDEVEKSQIGSELLLEIHRSQQNFKVLVRL